MNTEIKTIDEYIKSHPESVQAILNRVRKTVAEVAPDAKEKIGYGIPTLTLNGKNLVHFAAYKSHIGFYPGSSAIEVFKEELSTYETSKGTVRFPIDKEIPLDLIRKITEYCVARNASKN